MLPAGRRRIPPAPTACRPCLHEAAAAIGGPTIATPSHVCMQVLACSCMCTGKAEWQGGVLGASGRPAAFGWRPAPRGAGPAASMGSPGGALVAVGEGREDADPADSPTRAGTDPSSYPRLHVPVSDLRRQGALAPPPALCSTAHTKRRSSLRFWLPAPPLHAPPALVAPPSGRIRRDRASNSTCRQPRRPAGRPAPGGPAPAAAAAVSQRRSWSRPCCCCCQPARRRAPTGKRGSRGWPLCVQAALRRPRHHNTSPCRATACSTGLLRRVYPAPTSECFNAMPWFDNLVRARRRRGAAPRATRPGWLRCPAAPARRRRRARACPRRTRARSRARRPPPRRWWYPRWTTRAGWRR